MAQDPLTGRFLPRGMSVRSHVPAELNVRDAGGRFIGGDRHEMIVEAFRDYRGASSTARTVYDAWRFRMTDESPGRRDEPLSDGEAEIIDRWLHDPTLPRDDSRIARLQQILDFAPIRGGGLVAPEDICTHDAFAIRRFCATRIPAQFTIVRAHPGFNGVGCDLDSRVERRGHWLVGEGVREVYGRTSLRRVADLQEWRRVCPSLPQDTEACADLILTCATAIGIPPRTTPAGMAWRFFRSFLTDPLPALPLEALAMAENCAAEYVILGPTVRGCPIESYIYDLNAAYAYWLRDWPDLSRGRWIPVTKWTHHIALYHHRTGVVSGQALLEAWDVEPYRTWRSEINSGWAWDGDWNTPEPSPFRRFVDACLTYAGPIAQLVRRFPAFVVGKSRSAEWCDHILYARGAYYPAIWSNVVGALQARMLTTLRRVKWIAAFIDAVHTTEPFPTDWLGASPGLWKMIDQGATTYSGVGNWQSPHEIRHQGKKLDWEAAPL